MDFVNGIKVFFMLINELKRNEINLFFKWLFNYQEEPIKQLNKKQINKKRKKNFVVLVFTIIKALFLYFIII